MIRFIDIENGEVYNGSKPYVFWMDKEQSIGMIYVKKICILSDEQTLNISIPTNPVFTLLDMSRLNTLTDIDINEFHYTDINRLKTNSLVSTGVDYDNYYVHMIYISGQSDTVGEVHETFTIDDETFEVAADFYAENESLKVNLANFGVQIPESIQNAIYDENIHEESKDNILLNRKYKELLLNYWSIVAGRGNYQSLIDSLNWFEYGDLVKIEELWRHDEWSQSRLNREQLNAILSDDIKTTLNNFAKTTYLGIYLALQKFLLENGEIQYDKLDNQVNISSDLSEQLVEDSDDYEGLIGEMTPKLEKKIFKWSVEEMSMKMYLLGSFYEAYFMPIHLDLLHSTIESLVFTNTIKCINNTHMDRVDHMFNTQAFDCNVKDNQTFKLQDVHVQGGDTLLKHYDDSEDSSDDSTNMVRVYDSSDDYDSFQIFGIEEQYTHPMQFAGDDSSDDIVNNRIKTFMLNDYNGQGVVIPFNCTIPAETGDFINREHISVYTYRNDELVNIKEIDKHQLYKEINKQFIVDFNLLITEEGYTEVVLYFSTAGGRSYIKTLHLNILGDTICKLKMYKVKSCVSLTGLNADEYDISKVQDVDPTTGTLRPYPFEFLQAHIRSFNDYMFTHTRGYNELNPEYYQTFISGVVSDPIKNGVKLNHVLIFDADFFNHADQTYIDYVTDNAMFFDIGKKEVENGPTYYILVSKLFVGDYPGLETVINDLRNKYLKGYILRYSKGYFFQHHYLEELGTEYVDGYSFGESLNSYTITDNDTLCVVPDLLYSNISLDQTEWVFRNVSTINKEEYIYPSIKEPFVGNNIKQTLTPGYYDIIFRYKIGETWNESVLNSAFRKV